MDTDVLVAGVGMIPFTKPGASLSYHEKRAQTPLGRAGSPVEAAGAVYLFCLSESNYISGQVVVCGGGYLL